MSFSVFTSPYLFSSPSPLVKALEVITSIFYEFKVCTCALLSLGWLLVLLLLMMVLYLIIFGPIGERHRLIPGFPSPRRGIRPFGAVDPGPNALDPRPGAPQIGASSRGTRGDDASPAARQNPAAASAGGVGGSAPA